MSTNTVANLDALRAEMKRCHVDVMIIPGVDAHQSEYICEHWKCRDWVTGFTGSNGTAVVTLTDGKLWTDSRYFLQAEIQLEDSGFELMKEDVPGEPTIHDWLAENIQQGAVLAIDGTLFSINAVDELEMFCGENGFRLATDFTPFDTIWKNRPSRPSGKVFIHDAKYAGESVASKIERLLEIVESNGADSIFIPALDEQAWLLNLRCDDVRFTPVTIANTYISKDDKVIFVDDEKLTDEVRQYLADNGVRVMPYDLTAKYLSKLNPNEVVLVDPNRVSDTLGRAMDCGKIYVSSPIVDMKATKNDIQIAGTRNAIRKDCVALVKTFKWIEENVAKGGLKESSVWDKAIEYRKEQDLYVFDSFSMIPGYKEHGAIVHYSVTEESDAQLEPNGLLLVDTGGQYLDGTTDFTRTVSLGNITEQEIHDYTLVLKGHIAIASQVFPLGTRGDQLDALARQFMWKEGITYLHGTGHGVGHFLGVHEAPQNIRLNHNPTTLKPGMITSDEPGIYRAGSHGIRIENLILVVPAFENEEFGTFYKFETLTLFPYERNLIDLNMLSEEELAWINAYHKRVFETLSPALNADESAWLAAKTAPLTK